MNRPDPLPEELELLVPDINGIPRGKCLSGSAFSADSQPRLSQAILFHTVTGGYGDAMAQYNPHDGDLILDPDWSTYRPTPWKSGSVGQVICNTLDASGKPVAYDPRNVLKKVLAVYAEQGLTPIIAPEVEFYLLQPVRAHDLSLRTAVGNAGAAEFGGESFNPDALDKYSELFEDIRMFSRMSGLELEAVVHEMGPAQVELNVTHGDVLSRTDQLFQLKRLIKGCAARHDLLASFMAKPLEALPGNGLHVHCSMLDADGQNIFKLKRGKAPDTLLHFIGGLQQYLPLAFALVSPNLNSFKRFVRDLSAPINLEWGYDNRSTGFRVPHSDAAAGRVENRVAGADANPYLIVAATLACGLLGLQNETPAKKPIRGDAYELTTDFPEDLADALRILEDSDALIDLLGQSFVDVFISVKRNELSHFARSITQWEVQYLGSAI